MNIRFYNPNKDFFGLEKLLKETSLYYEPIDKEDIFKAQIKHDPKSIIIAEEKGRIIGTIFILYNPWQSFIYHLGVHPEYRNCGIGDKLMDKAEKILKKRSIKQPTLFIEKDNEKIIEFYKKRDWFVLYEVLCMEKKI